MNKKFIIVLASSSMLLSSLLTGCGNAKATSKKETSSSAISESAPTNALTNSQSDSHLASESTPSAENDSSSNVKPPSNTESSSTAKTSSKPSSESKNMTDENTAKDNTSTSSTGSESVKAALKLYEATYFDESVYGVEDEKIIDGVYQPDDYYNVDISNVTDTAFDFTIYKVDGKTEDRSLIFKKHTAIFTGDGTTAAYNGEKYTLNFTFPDLHGAHPDIADMQISGFAPLNGVTLVYNQIPGHEFG